MIKTKFLILPIFLLLLVSCQSKKPGFAPKNVKDKKIAYYSSYISGSADKDLEDKNVVYHFKDNGTYSSYFEGKDYQFGDYSYYYMSEDVARIAISYSSNNQSFTYIYLMTFTSEGKGTWRTVYTNEKAITGEEKGTFTMLDDH